MVKTIILSFDGFYGTKELPLKNHHCSGIYIVYRGRITNLFTYRLTELLYIGESETVGTRPGKKHESYKEWRSYLDRKEKESLFFTFADVPDADRKRAEAALIYHHQPPCNYQNKESFDYPETRIIISGISKGLDTDFTEPVD